MSTPQISNPNSDQASETGQANRALVLPSFLQAGIYLAFGLITVFYQQPSLTGLEILLGAFLLLLGASTYLTGARLRGLAPTLSQGLGSTGLILAATAALLLLVAKTELVFLIIVAVGLGLASILKILLGMRAKNLLVAAKDWQLEGLFMTLAAAAITFTGEIGLKALMGTLGGGALLAGIFLVIGALSLQHDSKNTQKS